MSSRKNIGLAQFCRRYHYFHIQAKKEIYLELWDSWAFSFDNKYKFKIAIEKKTLCVASKESVDAHDVDTMVVWHLLCKRNSPCFVCTFCFTTIDSIAFKANGFVCHMACKSALKSPINFFLFYMRNLSIYLLVWQ
jgi:hypothetical protein